MIRLASFYINEANLITVFVFQVFLFFVLFSSPKWCRCLKCFSDFAANYNKIDWVNQDKVMKLVASLSRQYFISKWTSLCGDGHKHKKNEKYILMDIAHFAKMKDEDTFHIL